MTITNCWPVRLVWIVLLSALLLTATYPDCVGAEEMLETLDQFICLRSSGFFPHDVRCDHFYECRNSTIINEGICKAGLRFDYRYRKKPRCISSDAIDCRITQIDSTPTTNYWDFSTGVTSPMTTERITFTPAPTTTTTTTTTTPAPVITTTSTTTTTTTPAPTIFTAETPTVWPQHMSTRTRTRSGRNRAKSLQKLSEDHLMSSAEDMEDDNTLTKKRKLLRKPLKLRRGHLAESNSAYIASGNNLQQHHRQSATTHHSHRLDDNNHNANHANHHLATEDEPVEHNSLLSRTVASDYSPKPTVLSRPKSSHCPHLSGYYADREDCRKFYACDDGRAFPMSCPLGLAYDEVAGTCNWPDMVEGCRSEEMLRFTCPEPYENDLLDYGDPRYPTSDCRKFVVCVLSDLYGSRTPRLLGCEEGLVFNPDSKSCDYPENVPTCANYYDSNPGALQANKFRRAQVSLPKKRRVRL